MAFRGFCIGTLHIYIHIMLYIGVMSIKECKTHFLTLYPHGAHCSAFYLKYTCN